MSALWEGFVAPPARTRLRAVARPAPRLARMPFMLVLIGVFGLGMAGLLMLNTTLQNQAFQARTLNRQVTELAYVQHDLEQQLDARSAPGELARAASALRMRPNPQPAFLVLPDGTVVGEPKPVSGHERPELVVKTPEQLAAEAAKKKAAAEAKQQAAAEAEQKAAAEAKEKAAAEAEKNKKKTKKADDR